MSHSATPWIPGASLAPVEPVETGADVVARMGLLRTQAQVIATACATGDLTARIAADFAQACDQAARAVLRLVEQRSPVVDPELRDSALGLFRNSGPLTT